MQLKKRQITARIPEELYEKCNAMYDNMTDAVIAGLEMLCNANCNANEVKCNAEEVKCNANEAKCNADVINRNANCNADVISISEHKAEIQILNSEITRLKNVIMDSPDPVDIARLQAINEGLNMVITEKEKRIEDLTREVTTLNGFAHYFKTAEVKQIEAPGEKKPWWKFW